LFIRVTDCSIRVSPSFTRGLQSPCPPGCCMHLYDCDYEIYNIVAQPYYCWCHIASKQSHRTPHLHIYRLKRRCFVTSYVNPLYSSMNQQLFKKNFCNQSSHYENYRQFNGSHHVSTTKSTRFMVNKDE